MRIPCAADAGNGALIESFQQITHQGFVGLGFKAGNLTLITFLKIDPGTGTRIVIHRRKREIPNTPGVENFMNKQGLASTNALTPCFVAIGHVLDTGGVLLGEVGGFARVG